METYYSSTVEAHHNSSKPSVDASFKLDRSHVNGQVGVSSLGKSTWKSIYDPSSFKPPKVRSLAPGLVIKPVIPGYVFGKGQFGKGYYSLKCRESYDVLLDRIDIMIKVAKEDKRRKTKLGIIGCVWVCLPCYFAHYKKKIAKLEEVKEFAKLRRNASGPDVKIELTDTLQKRLNKNIRNHKKQNDCGYYDDSAYYTDAVSCGASADGGFYTDRGGGGTKVREGGGFVETLYQSLWDGTAFASQPGRPQGPLGPRPRGHYGTFNNYFCGGYHVGGGYDEGGCDAGECDEGYCDGGDCDGGDCGGDD